MNMISACIISVTQLARSIQKVIGCCYLRAAALACLDSEFLYPSFKQARRLRSRRRFALSASGNVSTARRAREPVCAARDWLL